MLESESKVTVTEIMISLVHHHILDCTAALSD